MLDKTRWVSQWRNNHNQFGWVAIILHWVSAVLVVGLLALGVWMVTLGYYSQWYNIAPALHKSIGVVFAILLSLRLVWRCLNQQPQGQGTKLEKLAAYYSHWLVYLFLFSIVISGYLIVTAEGVGVSVFNTFTIPALDSSIDQQADLAGWWHRWLSYILGGLLFIHIAAALKHQFFDRDGSIGRMLGQYLPPRKL